ncbi:hemerythrin domain-containing protein [Parasporobacterium paucivorans]|uniref:Hemerythrin-like domain-containing protein n=1 Tax=Parasporobacterium paucivorans DSM 15970 TaxID=1122934 RepID=A0A1M6EMK2_9FIRM|nr:hemerythrin domain-containing protein [Parasporobacterium paucivorans]SHI86721.1 Hemerythrin-like domain-containing protein [Parasporobacterium paucivorans DSM 15970]
MNSIQLMVEEHDNILRMLEIMRKASYRILKGEEINQDDFKDMISFAKYYADAHHHGKEEEFLFTCMVDNLGKLGENLVTHGMLVEHGWNRLFIMDLKNALERVEKGEDEAKLDVIANAVGFANQMIRHIGKENEVVYTFAEKELSPEVLEHMNAQVEEFEAEATAKGIQQHYLAMLDRLEVIYK